MNVLAIAAHPDDETLGPGATLARHAAAGDDVTVVLLSSGVGARGEAAAAVAERRDHARAAADALGVRRLVHHDLPDNRFDTVALLDVVRLLEAAIADVRAEVVYTHSGGDLNVDHAVAFRATLTATRPLPGTTVRRVLAYEVPSSTESALGRLAPAFRPNVFVDVEATLERKLIAMAAYRTETRPAPHPRSADALRALARWRGATAGLAAAEAFELVREVARREA